MDINRGDEYMVWIILAILGFFIGFGCGVLIGDFYYNSTELYKIIPQFFEKHLDKSKIFFQDLRCKMTELWNKVISFRDDSPKPFLELLQDAKRDLERFLNETEV